MQAVAASLTHKFTFFIQIFLEISQSGAREAVKDYLIEDRFVLLAVAQLRGETKFSMPDCDKRGVMQLHSRLINVNAIYYSLIVS